MRSYRSHIRGLTPEGAIVIRFYRSGDQIRAFLREVNGADEDETVFPSEELEPEIALRLADNKLQRQPSQPIYVELTDGIQWVPGWGDLS